MHTTTEGKAATQEQAVSKGFTPDQASDDKSYKILSRFGQLEVNDEKAICFEHGLLGIPGKANFFLTDFPNQDTGGKFKLLQCKEDESLCFIVVPSQFDNQMLDPQDLEEACKIIETQPADLLVLFIVTVHVENGERKLSVNARAPILIDASKLTATQYVFQNTKYSIRHMIS